MPEPPKATDVCFLCGRNPVSWPGTGLCEPCFQETADLAHRAWAEMPPDNADDGGDAT